MTAHKFTRPKYEFAEMKEKFLKFIEEENRNKRAQMIARFRTKYNKLMEKVTKVDNENMTAEKSAKPKSEKTQLQEVIKTENENMKTEKFIKYKSEHDILQEENDKLESMKILIMREKIEMENELQFFENIYTQMKHSTGCLDDETNHILEERDYSLDPCLKNTSCGSETSQLKNASEVVNNGNNSTLLKENTPDGVILDYNVTKFDQCNQHPDFKFLSRDSTSDNKISLLLSQQLWTMPEDSTSDSGISLLGSQNLSASPGSNDSPDTFFSASPGSNGLPDKCFSPESHSYLHNYDLSPPDSSLHCNVISPEGRQDVDYSFSSEESSPPNENLLKSIQRVHLKGSNNDSHMFQPSFTCNIKNCDNLCSGFHGKLSKNYTPEDVYEFVDQKLIQRKQTLKRTLSSEPNKSTENFFNKSTRRFKIVKRQSGYLLGAKKEGDNSPTTVDDPKKDCLTTAFDPKKEDLSAENDPKKESLPTENDPKKESLKTENDPKKEHLTTVFAPKKESLTVENDPKKESLTTENDPKKESLPTENDSKKESLPTENDSKKESLTLENDSKKESLPTENDPKKESMPTENDPKKESLPTEYESKNESLPTENDPKKESLPTENDSKKKSLPTENDPKKDNLNTENGPKKESLPTEMKDYIAAINDAKENCMAIISDMVVKSSTTENFTIMATLNNLLEGVSSLNSTDKIDVADVNKSLDKTTFNLTSLLQTMEELHLEDSCNIEHVSKTGYHHDVEDDLIIQKIMDNLSLSTEVVSD